MKLKIENIYRRKMLIHHFIEEVRDEDIEEILCATVTRLMVRAHGMPENEALLLEIAIDHLLNAEEIIRKVDNAEQKRETTILVPYGATAIRADGTKIEWPQEKTKPTK